MRPRLVDPGRMLRRWLATALWALACLPAAAGTGAPASDAVLERGRALYFNEHDALAASQPRLDGAPVPSAAAACVSCHRRSGLGSAEGTVLVPPVAGHLLFAPLAPQTGQRLPWPSRDRTRPAYDAATLAAALRHGHAPDGVLLKAPMPRYALGDADVAALVAYLRTLSAQRAPGVDDEEVLLATITTPDVPANEVGDLLRTLDAFLADKNAGTRGESRRRAQALRNDDSMYRRYRRWRLVHWALQGDPATWTAQLEERYRATPVFAVLSGISYDTWQPVHAFCARRNVPCLLPNASLPAEEEDFYTVYFSLGLHGQARAVAKELAATGVREAVVWSPASPTGDRQRAAIRAALATEGIGLAVREARDGDAVIAALDLPELLRRTARGTPAGRVYALDGALGLLPDRWDGSELAARPNVILVTDFAGASSARRQPARSRMWVNAKRIAPSSERVAVNALQAATIAVESLMHVDDSFSREYCIEKLEHTLENMPPLTAYPRLGIGPGQRFATRRVSFVAPATGGERAP